ELDQIAGLQLLKSAPDERRQLDLVPDAVDVHVDARLGLVLAGEEAAQVGDHRAASALSLRWLRWVMAMASASAASDGSGWASRPRRMRTIDCTWRLSLRP